MDSHLLFSLLEPAIYWLNPQMRIFWLYLLASLLLAFWVIWRQTGSWRLFTTRAKDLFAAHLWWNSSSGLDLKWIGLNHLLKVALLLPISGSQLSLALAVNRGLIQWFGEGNFVVTSASTTMLLFSVTLFLVDDFFRFWLHYLYHKVPLLWRFHAIHHSAPTLTPLTLYRVHTVEMVFNTCRSIGVTGLISGLFIYTIEGPIGAAEILGASIFQFAFNMAGSNLRHSPFWLGFGRVEKWLISPAQHQIHHSIHRRHYDKNFGSILAIWDRLFGCWLSSEGQTVKQFGLTGNSGKQSLWQQLAGIKES